MLSNFFKNKANLFFLSLLLVSAILEIAFRLSYDFSEFYCIFIAQAIKIIFKPLSYIPFAFSESLIIAAVLVIVLCVVLTIAKAVSLLIGRSFNSHLKTIFKYIFRVGAVVLFLFSATFSSSYHRKSLTSLIDINTVEVNRENLEYATKFAADRLYEISKYISYTPGQMTSFGGDFEKLSREVERAVDKAAERYIFLQESGVRAKPLALSVPMTYTHIAGVYTFFTGEPCVNINYPEYSLPYTTAHEYAHQRGIGYENEADFMAFLILLESDHIYLHYSAWAEAYTVLSNELYDVDREAALEISATLPDVVINDYRLSAQSLSKYADSMAGDVARDINDAYLKANGVEEGVRSYSESVVLLVSLICG